MTIIEKWFKMLNSFSDIKAAIEEKGGSVSGYSGYAKGARSIYSAGAYTPKHTYPRGNIQERMAFCKNVKEEIRQAIAGSGVECGEDVPLSEYGNKIRQISTVPLRIITEVIYMKYNEQCNIQLEAEGGRLPYKWKMSNEGFAIPGISLAEDGVVTGAPTIGGASINKNVTVTDASGKTVKKRICFIIISQA